LQFAQGVPDDFRETPAEAGFVTVYAATSNVGSIGVKSAPVPAPAPASFIPRFQVSTWKVLLEETAAGRRETIARWRAIDTSWSIEEIPAWRESQIQEAQGRMNFHEVELLAEAR
jgi:hypothetical protein